MSENNLQNVCFSKNFFLLLKQNNIDAMKNIDSYLSESRVDKFLYDNIGASKKSIYKDMSDWGKEMENEGRFPGKWCIMDGEINIIGDVDMRGAVIKYPIGVVNGVFRCDPAEKKSSNYPRKIVPRVDNNYV